uniref:Ig-like domain-containing protein n=1 Tax=Cyprinodon variegatus TaxID=28743 RepID=A0A3Q2FIG4_CYPVA
MDLFILKSLVFPLCFLGHSAGKNVLPASPLEAYLGENKTLNILVEKEKSDIIIWKFKNETTFLYIATLQPSGLTVNDRYKGRAFVDSANGYLTLISVKLEDTGNYTISIVGTQTLTGQVELHIIDVLPPILELPPLISENRQKEHITLTCLANQGYPSEWDLHWHISIHPTYINSSVKWEEEWNPGILQDDKFCSWRSSLKIAVVDLQKINSVTCIAHLGSLAPVRVKLKAEQIFKNQTVSEG